MKRFTFKIALAAFFVVMGIYIGSHAVESAVVENESTARVGINLAGAEFGGTVVPGTHGVNYIYPGVSTLDYYKSKGRTLVRLPFKWERIQHTLNGPLDREELERLRDFLRRANERQMDVILDVHNYGRYQIAGQEKYDPFILGSEQLPYSAFADLWSKLVIALKDEPAVFAYGLMNEPYGMGDDMRWPRAAQAAVNAIRKIDTETPIYVSGDQFGSSRDWKKGSNATLHEKVRDPANNLVFEAHCYFDHNLSGQYTKDYIGEGATPDVGIEHVRPFVEWCKENGVRGFIGEFGIPDNDTRWLVVMDRFLQYLQQNNTSAAYWAGGPWWGDYSLAVEPRDARAGDTGLLNPPDRPQMLVLRQYPG